MIAMTNNKAYKRMLAAVCFFLALCMGLIMPLQIYAESTNVTYLSDIKLCCAKSKDEAKSTLENEGYTFQPGNLNEGTNRETQVYLGYKTTKNADMAITDIRMLGMESGFQLYDYKEMVEYLKNEQSGVANTMREAAMEFAQKYGEDSPKAISAYKGLNLFYVDEADMKLGDFIVAGKADLDFFMTMIVKSSTATLNAVMGYLNAGIAPYENGYDEDEGETVSLNWAQQLPDSPVYAILENNPTVDEIKDMKKQYNDNARETFKQIQSFVTQYENAIARNPKGEPNVEAQTDEEAIEAADNIESEDADIVYIEAFNKLNEYPYNDSMTIAEWLLDVGHQTADKIDLTQLYPLIDVMSDAQNDLVGDTGFLTAVSNLGENERAERFEETLPEVQAAIKEYNGSNAISIWDNADDDLQNSKIAFTSEAVRRQAANNLVIKHDEVDVGRERFELVSKWVTFSIGVLSVIVFVSAKIVTAVAATASSVTLASTLTTMLPIVGVVGAVGMWVGVVAAVATVALLLYFWITSLIDDEDDPEEYIELPGYVIDAQAIAGGEIGTIRYKTVLSNKEHDGKYYGDLNGWEESRWNSLAYTTDKAVGSPIRMDNDNNIFKIVYGDAKTPDGYAPLRPFGERDAGNCNYSCEKDKVGGIYVFYRTEKSMTDEAPEAEESQTEEKKATNGYLASLIVATADSEAQAKAKINKQTIKYNIFDRNLSSGMGYATYVGYTVTMNPDQAITDIRVAPYNGNNSVNYGDSQYIFAGTVGVNMGGGESNANSQNDALMFTTNPKAGSPILAGSFHATNSTNDAKAGWEAVTPFACGIPYDFNVTHINGYSGNKSEYKPYTQYEYSWESKKYSYLYFEPSVQYKSGEKYVSGIFFFNGTDSYQYLNSTDKNEKLPAKLVDPFSFYEDKFREMKNVKLYDDVNLTQAVKDFTHHYGRNLTTHIGYTYTYNPKRAIYDLALFQGTPYTPSLPYSVSKKQADNSVVSYIASTMYVRQDAFFMDSVLTYRAISNFNSFMNNQGNVLQTKCCYGITNNRHYTSFSSDFIEYGYTHMAYQTVGLYATGYAASKQPLRLCDLVITKNKYDAQTNGNDIEVKLNNEKALDGSVAKGAFRCVSSLQCPSSTDTFDFGYPDIYFGKDNTVEGKGTHLYLYIRGAAKTKGKYIASIALGAYSKELYQNGINSKKDSGSVDGLKYSVDMYAMSSACAVSADEVLIKNLAVNQSDAWYNRKGSNSSENNVYGDRHKHNDYNGDAAKQSTIPPDISTSAYVGVTRTDNPNNAIRGVLLVQNDKWTTEKTIKIGRVVYYCDAIQTPMRVNGHNYYLYYTFNKGVNAGQPIEDISIDSNALIAGAATAISAKDSDIEGERTVYADKGLPSFLHLHYDHSNIKGAFFNKLYIGTGNTRNEALLELAANECVEFLDLDLNDGASGHSVYLGYRYGMLDQNAINQIKDSDKRDAEKRAQMQEAVCDIVVTQGEPYHPDGFVSENSIYYAPVANKNLNEGNLGDELYMYYTSDYVSETYNRKNNAATYLAYDYFSPIKALALSRYDCVPYNSEYAKTNYRNDLVVYEYVMRSDEKLPIDLNANILVTDDDYLAKGDNRITMFVARYDNAVKDSAQITGGYVGKTTDVGKLTIQH